MGQGEPPPAETAAADIHQDAGEPAQAPISYAAAGDAAPPHIEHAPSIAPDEPQDSAAAPTPNRKGKLDYFELRRRRTMRALERKRRGLGITNGHVAAACLGILLALIFARETVVRVFPQTASLYGLAGLGVNLRGLVFEDIKTSYETQDGVRVISIEGDIRNITSSNQPVARLRFALRNDKAAETYSWTAIPERVIMASGEVQHFKTRLASPPTDSKELRVRFFHPRDLADASASGAPPSPAKH
ncbi:MAG: hypothetical protein ACXWJW_13275, partial [Xanthobacteraceae bacterium]